MFKMCISAHRLYPIGNFSFIRQQIYEIFLSHQNPPKIVNSNNIYIFTPVFILISLLGQKFKKEHFRISKNSSLKSSAFHPQRINRQLTTNRVQSVNLFILCRGAKEEQAAKQAETKSRKPRIQRIKHHPHNTTVHTRSIPRHTPNITVDTLNIPRHSPSIPHHTPSIIVHTPNILHHTPSIIRHIPSIPRHSPSTSLY